jgi:hypothetical protein
MYKNKYIIALYLIITFIFGSCEDPLKIDETLSTGESAVTVPDLYPPRDLTYHSVTLNWSQYNNNDFDRYELYYLSSFHFQYSLSMIIRDKKICYLPLTELLPGVDYYFYIRVINKAGNYADSKIINVHTFSDKPSPVTNFGYKKTPEDNNIIKLFWDKYKENDIVSFSRYEVYSSEEQYFQLSPETLRDKISMINNNYTFFDITKLNKNTIYSFKVRIYNILEKYAESDYLTFRTP